MLSLPIEVGTPVPTVNTSGAKMISSHSLMSYLDRRGQCLAPNCECGSFVVNEVQMVRLASALSLMPAITCLPATVSSKGKLSMFTCVVESCNVDRQPVFVFERRPPFCTLWRVLSGTPSSLIQYSFLTCNSLTFKLLSMLKGCAFALVRGCPINLFCASLAVVVCYLFSFRYKAPQLLHPWHTQPHPQLYHLLGHLPYVDIPSLGYHHLSLFQTPTRELSVRRPPISAFANRFNDASRLGDAISNRAASIWRSRDTRTTEGNRAVGNASVPSRAASGNFPRRLNRRSQQKISMPSEPLHTDDHQAPVEFLAILLPFHVSFLPSLHRNIPSRVAGDPTE